MWLFTTEGAYSVIEWHDGTMCVRARMPGDIGRLRKLMPELGPEAVSPTKDYRYRAFVTREGLREGMVNIADSITYGNFKSAVEKTGRPGHYKKGLHAIWSIMASWQPGGAYGMGRGQPVPKSERKLEAKLKAKNRRDRSGDPCDDCGKVRPDDEMVILGNRWLCRDIADCRPTGYATSMPSHLF